MPQSRQQNQLILTLTLFCVLFCNIFFANHLRIHARNVLSAAATDTTQTTSSSSSSVLLSTADYHQYASTMDDTTIEHTVETSVSSGQLRSSLKQQQQQLQQPHSSTSSSSSSASTTVTSRSGTNNVGNDVRKHAKTTLKKCTNLPKPPKNGNITTALPKEWFKSQSNEDEHLLNTYFSGPASCDGTYLEMGGLDGIRKSNTYVFNKGLGWKGILIEASPHNFASLQRQRPNEIATINAAICENRQRVHWIDNAGAANGIWEFADVEFRTRWWASKYKNTPKNNNKKKKKKARKGKNNDKHNGSVNVDIVEQEILKDSTIIECVPLRDVLNEQIDDDTMLYFDFFSLDIEGSEFGALLSIDYSRVEFGVILVEANTYGNQKRNLMVQTLLESNGYKFMYEKHRSLWFINANFHNIYKHLYYL